MNGSISDQAQIVKNFAKILDQNVCVSIYLQDERLTSKSADSLLKSFGFTRKQRNAMDDAIAASIILEATLDSMKHLDIPKL
jgi:putative Holliday junction resolvase